MGPKRLEKVKRLVEPWMMTLVMKVMKKMLI